MDAKVFFSNKQTNKRYTLKNIKQEFLEILLRKDRDSICLRKLLTKGFID